jgi:hypothetical protein
MIRRSIVAAAFVAFAGTATANTFTVRHTGSGGPGSLRWAIRRANLRTGPDQILFKPGLKGKVILPTSSLPNVVDGRTKIIGDINGDGAPDIAINGKFAGSGSGLVIEADNCIIAGLAVTNFPRNGIHLNSADNCVIRSCHVGVNLAGTKIARNGWDQIRLDDAHGNTIGGPTKPGRNVIAGGAASPVGYSGIALFSSGNNVIRNSNIGVALDGRTALTAADQSGNGIFLHGSPPAGGTGNRIGGATDRERNVIGGANRGIHLRESSTNTILGNYIGLARNGNTSVPIGDHCIWIRQGSTYNMVGGTDPAHRNFLAGGSGGILFADPETAHNSVLNNYLGVNAAGTKQRALTAGVKIASNALRQQVGDDDAGNTICVEHPSVWATGVLLDSAGSGTYIEGNRIGFRPDATAAEPYKTGVSLSGVWARVFRNRIGNAYSGVLCSNTPEVVVTGNSFHSCDAAVRVWNNGQANLGDRGNSAHRDDGHNAFWPSNTWYIRNEAPHTVKAEGNRFATTDVAVIHQKIWDYADDNSRGVVDIEPTGGILITLSVPSSLTVTGAAAVPTAAGAEIAFSLSAPADVTVTVLNLAGRAVATVARDRKTEAGTQRLVWSRRTAQGTRAPSGKYVVRISACGADGEQRTALCGVTLP